MEAKDRAEELVNEFRVILMDEDTECGNEVLCTSIAVKHALIVVREKIETIDSKFNGYYTLPKEWKKEVDYLLEVETELKEI